MKQTEKQPKQIEFRFVSVRTKKKIDCFKDTLALPKLFKIILESKTMMPSS